jgi:glycosyltransferase involved in cell wall biosynthesis
MTDPKKKQGCLRTRDVIKNSHPTEPLISIVTVVFNGKDFIEETIQSVVNQSYERIEYIIIDGGSTDGTLDIVREYENSIDYWTSESDNGIYDAMNKGANICHGDWINFLNVGDRFYDRDVLLNLKSHLNGHDVAYGSTLLNKNDGLRLMAPRNLSSICAGRLPFVHQSSLIRSKIFKSNYFSENYAINSDFNLFLQLYLARASFYKYAGIISIYDGHGFSSQNKKRGHLEKIDILRSKKIPRTRYYLYHWLSYIRSALRTIFGPTIRTLNIKKLRSYY